MLISIVLANLVGALIAARLAMKLHPEATTRWAGIAVATYFICGYAIVLLVDHLFFQRALPGGESLSTMGGLARIGVALPSGLSAAVAVATLTRRSDRQDPMSEPQLVGSDCAVCGAAIAIERQATRCASCGEPMHLRCADTHDCGAA
jgi:hypothetical protein